MVDRPQTTTPTTRTKTTTKLLTDKLRFQIRILSADLIGLQSLPTQQCLFCRLRYKGEVKSKTQLCRKPTKTPIWNQELQFVLPERSRDISQDDYRNIELQCCQPGDKQSDDVVLRNPLVLGTATLLLSDIIHSYDDGQFGGELILTDVEGKKIGRLMFKANSDYPYDEMQSNIDYNNNKNQNDNEAPRIEHNNTSETKQQRRYQQNTTATKPPRQPRQLNNNNNQLHLPVMTSPIRTSNNISFYSRSNSSSDNTATTDSQRYLEMLRQSSQHRTQREINRQAELEAENRRIALVEKKRKKRRNKKKNSRSRLAPGPASYNLPTTLESGGGRFSNANPKSYIDWASYRAKQTPGPNEYGFGDRRPTTSGGRFNTSKPKSELDWVVYHAQQVPGPCEYQLPLDRPRKDPGGGKISEARPKELLDWVVYHSREIPAPNAYPPLPNPKINGGKFSNANPKSDLDWVIYRAKQTPSPNEYGDGGRPKTTGGRFNMSNPKSQLDWVTYFGKRTPSSADYTLPEGASSDYFTASVNQSRPPGFQGSLYGSGVGSVRFPTGDSRPREGKWVQVPGGQIWSVDGGGIGSPPGTAGSSKRRRRRRRRKKKSSNSIRM